MRSIEHVAGLIADMKAMRPECDCCDNVSYSRVVGDYGDLPTGICKLEARGYELDIYMQRMLKRCAVCSTSRVYPWADRLDVERVHQWLNENCARGILILDRLKELA